MNNDIRFDTVDENDYIREVPLVEVLTAFADKSRMFFVAQEGGIDDALVTIERTLYPPSSGDNRVFLVTLAHWRQSYWYLFSVPASDYDKLGEVLLKHGMMIMPQFSRAAMRDAAHTPLQIFPVWADNVRLVMPRPVANVNIKAKGAE